MEINILGSFDARERDIVITPTAAKPRKVLALLALQAGQVVRVPTLMEELWGMTPPRSALTTLQTYIMQLRRRIESALGVDNELKAKDVLLTRYGGYVLDIPKENVDAHKFEELALRGRRAQSNGCYEEAAIAFKAALDVWKGQALVDVQAGTRLEVEVTRLEESRLSVFEARIDADLQLGKHQEVLAELSALTVRNVLHENFCAQYMVALYRSGRQWQALDVFKALRTNLIEEIGVEPSARLQHLHRAILKSDPMLELMPAQRMQSRQLALAW